MQAQEIRRLAIQANDRALHGDGNRAERIANRMIALLPPAETFSESQIFGITLLAWVVTAALSELQDITMLVLQVPRTIATIALRHALV